MSEASLSWNMPSEKEPFRTQLEIQGLPQMNLERSFFEILSLLHYPKLNQLAHP